MRSEDLLKWSPLAISQHKMAELCVSALDRWSEKERERERERERGGGEREKKKKKKKKK